MSIVNMYLKLQKLHDKNAADLEKARAEIEKLTALLLAEKNRKN